MTRIASKFPIAEAKPLAAAISPCYGAMMLGEFPWCFDESAETDAPSELVGSFNLIMAQPAQAGNQPRGAKQRSQPDTAWVEYGELFLQPGGSLLIFTSVESIGAYIAALGQAEMQYHTTYLWHHNSGQIVDVADRHVEAIIWASKGETNFKPFPAGTELITRPLVEPDNDTNLADERQWLIETLIAGLTTDEMTVLEPFMASGHALLACQKLHRYCLAVARKRSQLKQAEQFLLGGLKRTA